METWVDLLQSKSSLKKPSKRKTRSTKALKHSPVKQEVLLVDYSPGNNDSLQDGSELELLHLKLSQQQIAIAELTRERNHLLKQLESRQQRIFDDARLNVSSHDLKESSLTELQLQGLRDALDQVTMEKSSILSQSTLQRDEMTSLTNQLAEQQERIVAMTTAKDQMSTELYSCQQSLEECLGETEQLRIELHQKDEELEKQMDCSVELSVSVDKLRQQLAAVSNPLDGNDTLQSKLAEVSARNVEVEKKLLSCQQHNMLLEQQVASLQQANASLKIRNSTLEDTLIKAQLELDSLNSRLAAVDSSHHSDMLKLEQKLVESEKHVSQLNEKNGCLTSNIQQQTAHCKAMETEQSLLQAKYDQLIADKQLLEQQLHATQCSKVTNHDELLKQCESLRTELLQQTSSGVAMVTGLQQQLNDAKQIHDKLVCDYVNCQRERDDVTNKLCTVSVANEQLTITNQKLLIQISDTDAELVKVKSDWTESCRKLKLAEHEMKTLSNDCAELDKRLVTMETTTVVQLNEQIEKLTEKLHNSNCHNEALQVDKQALGSKLSELENIVNAKRIECVELQEHLNEMTMKCDQLLSDMQTSGASHMIQQQEISDLKMQLTELEEQVSSKIELTSEMNSLLAQRGCRIEELEKILASFDSTGKLYGEELHKVKHSCHKEVQTDTSSLNPTLSIYPATSMDPAMSVDSATIHSTSGSSHCTSSTSSPVHASGSYSPVQSISDIPDYSDKLMAAELQCNELQQKLANQRIQYEQDLTSESIKLKQELTNQRAKFERELTNQRAMLQQELANQRVKYDEQISVLNQQFKENMITVETRRQKEVSVLNNQISSLQYILTNQQTSLAGLVSSQATNVASLRMERCQVEERSQLVGLVSDSQQHLLKVTEDKIVQLIAEVELLRTRKAIMKECSDQAEKSAISEQEKVLLVKVDKLQSKVLVLCNQLKKKKRHCNYLRLRLGYVLAEVRLYKKLKTDLDGQISILQNGFEQSSRQHLMCINLLEQAEHMSGSVPLL